FLAAIFCFFLSLFFRRFLFFDVIDRQPLLVVFFRILLRIVGILWRVLLHFGEFLLCLRSQHLCAPHGVALEFDQLLQIVLGERDLLLRRRLLLIVLLVLLILFVFGRLLFLLWLEHRDDLRLLVVVALQREIERRQSLPASFERHDGQLLRGHRVHGR